MKKFLLLIPLIILSALLVYGFSPTFSSESEARSYVAEYEYPVFGTATIQSITTVLDSNEYVVTYVLDYSQDGESKSEVVQMNLYGVLPSDKVVEEKIQEHANHYFSSVLNKKPEVTISLATHSLIGKPIVIKEPVKDVETPLEELVGK